MWEKNLKKSGYIYIHITDSLCHTPETNRTWCINYTPIKILKKEKKKAYRDMS